jgi:hypothetical protein
MVHVRDDGFTFSNKPGNDERCTCANIGSTHGGAREFCFATHYCMMAVGANVGA